MVGRVRTHAPPENRPDASINCRLEAALDRAQVTAGLAVHIHERAAVVAGVDADHDRATAAPAMAPAAVPMGLGGAAESDGGNREGSGGRNAGEGLGKTGRHRSSPV